MWTLSSEQATRLTALQRRRDMRRLDEELAEVFPEARVRLGGRWGEFIALGAVRSAAYGLGHMLCIARLLAAWIVCGAEFEGRQPWAANILTDPKRRQGAKAYQLCVLVLELLRSAPQAGQPTPMVFAAALKQLDDRLAGAGSLASLLPREHIRLGSPCDLEAIELRLVDSGWRQHYTARGGPWRREPCAPPIVSVVVVHDALANAAPRLPDQVTLLSRPVGTDAAAGLRVRVKAEHRCDAALHPAVQWLDSAGPRTLRGDMSHDTTFAVHAPLRETAPGELPCIGEEGSPQFSMLTVSSCGLRARGVSIGELSTTLAAYDATQHLIAWRRESGSAWQLPAEVSPAIASARCRRESDGEVVDHSAWVDGFKALDLQLQEGVMRLLTGWERESGVRDGKLVADAALLVGSAGITWGWAEGPAGISAKPYMRLEGLLDLVACRLGLRFTGTFVHGGSSSLLTLSTDGSTALNCAWQRGPDDSALFAVAATLQRPVLQRFELAVQATADAGLAFMSTSGLLKGAISGAVGLEQRPDGPGLRWFVRLKVEQVVARLRLVDPLLGVQTFQQPLLPAQLLVDWSLA